MSIAQRGFTLIEVMIGVLILALGLLGLGAIIPVIVREQRLASDATLGVAAANAAKAYLDSRPDYNPSNTSSGAVPRTAWDVLLDDNNWSQSTGSIPYRWEEWGSEFDVTTGELSLSSSGANPVTTTLKVADRLWPSRSRQAVANLTGRDVYRPIFVWDFMARRLPSAAATIPSNEPQSLQVAVFVRRIDLNIRIPRNKTLAQILSDPTDADFRLAVAVDADGVPSGNGQGDYALPVVADASVNATNRNRVTLSGITTEQIELASSPGQKLVDNLGNVYTVLGVRDGAPAGEVVVEPHVPAWIGTTGPTQFRQAVFTPQIPAAVHVFTVTRPAK